MGALYKADSLFCFDWDGHACRHYSATTGQLLDLSLPIQSGQWPVGCDKNKGRQVSAIGKLPVPSWEYLGLSESGNPIMK